MLDDKSFTTPKGTVLPLMVFKRNQKEKDAKGVVTYREVISNYLQVAHRLVWFREERPEWGISTSILEHDAANKMAIVKATISNEQGMIMAQGTKVEHAAHFPDYLEKAETGAIGRALAMCGYGTQFAPELDEGDRLADAPQQGHKSNGQASNGNGNQRAAALSHIARLAKEVGVNAKDIPAELAEIGMLPEPIPSNRWTDKQVEDALTYFLNAVQVAAGAQ